MSKEVSVLEIREITKKFPGVVALNKVSFKIEAGKATVIIGENGAGKSTLMKILSGVHTDYSGGIYFNGEKVCFQNTTDAEKRGISIIHQELNLIQNLSIYENIFLGRELENAFGLMDVPKMKSETRKLLAGLKLDLDPAMPIYKLKVGQQQMIEIAKALSFNCKVIIMDEPTSAISDKEVKILFEVIEKLKAEGKAVIYISHKLDELFEIAENYVVLRDGEFIEDGKIKDIDEEQLINKMVGRQIDISGRTENYCSEEKLFEVSKLYLKNSMLPESFILKDIDFQLKKGEVLGIFGLMGAGRTELMETIFGLNSEHRQGKIFLNDIPLDLSSPEKARNAGLALVPENRKQDGLVLGMDIKRNTSLSVLDSISLRGFLSRNKEENLANSYIKKLKIKASSSAQKVEKLSGGNQQKVVLSKWLATNPKVLMLDEPTRGIDVNAKHEIYKLIKEFAAKGLGIIMVSSELPEILAVSDRVLVMAEGKITANFKITNQTSEDMILKAAIPKNKQHDYA